MYHQNRKYCMLKRRKIRQKHGLYGPSGFKQMKVRSGFAEQYIYFYLVRTPVYLKPLTMHIAQKVVSKKIRHGSRFIPSFQITKLKSPFDTFLPFIPNSWILLRDVPSKIIHRAFQLCLRTMNPRRTFNFLLEQAVSKNLVSPFANSLIPYVLCSDRNNKKRLNIFIGLPYTSDI